MKKIKLTISALLISSLGFTTNPPTKKQLIQEITINVEDLIDFVREHEYNGRIMTKELSKSYVQNLIDLLSKLEDLNTVTK